jgi:isocitrate dehydrogenase
MTQTKIQILADGKLIVPNQVEVPFITGDGIGPEIMPAMQQVVDAAVKASFGNERQIIWKEVAAGQHAYDTLGTYLPDETLKAFADYHVGIKGPLTTPVGGGIRSLNVAMRQGLDLYVCLRPVRWFKGIESPVKHPERVNMVVFRENTEDIYAGIEWKANSREARLFYEFLHDEMGVTKVRFPETSAFGVKPVSAEGSKRLVKAACQYAINNGTNHVTLVHKGNIMKFTEGGFKAWGYEVNEDAFEGKVRMDDCICDAFLQNALLKPEAYDVIATMNLNGDYISDMLAAQVGGIGISPGANINYEAGRAVFEATHGTAPDIAGTNQANPCSLILSGVMMLEHLGWNDAAERITHSLEQLFDNGYATADLARFMQNGHALGTKEFANALSECVAK